MTKEELMLLKIAVLNELEDLTQKIETCKNKVDEHIKWKNLHNKYSIILDKLQ